jgi:hypothetical protein
VKTAPHEKVSLCLVPGIFVEVAEQTDVRIDELRLIKWGNAMVAVPKSNEILDAMRSRMAVLRLGKGTVRASLSDLGSGQYNLKTKQKREWLWLDGDRLRQGR